MVSVAVSSSPPNKALDIKDDLGSPLSDEEQGALPIANLDSIVYVSLSHP
jgi:hypothetical protein